MTDRRRDRVYVDANELFPRSRDVLTLPGYAHDSRRVARPVICWLRRPRLVPTGGLVSTRISGAAHRMSSGAGRSTVRIAHGARRWWPVPAFVAVGLVAQQLLLMSRYEVAGHAGEHLGSASVPFLAAPLAAILLWATPTVRRQLDVLVCLLAWFGATLVVMVGNLRVVDDLVAAGYARTPTSAVPDVADHTLANSSVWWASAASLLVVAAFRWRGHIGNKSTGGAALATVLVPPWIIPGAGVVVLAVLRCIARRRELTSDPARSSDTVPTAARTI